MGQRVTELQTEIERRRRDAGAVVDELELRSGRLLDVRRQARRNPGLAVAAVAVPVALIGAGAFLLMRQRRKKKTFGYKARHATQEALDALETLRKSGFTITAAPAHEEEPSGFTRTVLKGVTAGLSALAPIIAKQIITQLMERTEEQERRRAGP